MNDRTLRESFFDNIIRHTYRECEYLAAVKGGEYAGNGDRLENFRRQARDLDLSMEQVWRVFAGKHWDAITTYVRDMQTGTERARSESITGRVDDLIVYLMLFKGILFERGVYAPPPEAEWNSLPAPAFRDQMRDLVEAVRSEPLAPPVAIRPPAPRAEPLPLSAAMTKQLELALANGEPPTRKRKDAPREP